MILAAELLPVRQQVIAIVLASLVLVVVLELVRKRKLREEYSVVWVLTSLVLLALAIEQRLLLWIMALFGAQQGNSVLFFCALLFLLLLALQFSIRMSRLTLRNKQLAQRMALLEREVGELTRKLSPQDKAQHAEKDEVA